MDKKHECQAFLPESWCQECWFKRSRAMEEETIWVNSNEQITNPSYEAYWD